MLLLYRSITSKCSFNQIVRLNLNYKSQRNFRTCLIDLDKKSKNTKSDNSNAANENVPKTDNSKSKAEKLRNFTFIQFNDPFTISKKPVLHSLKVETTQTTPTESKEVSSEQESAAVKLAKLIDKQEPNKTAETLLEPIKKMKTFSKKHSKQPQASNEVSEKEFKSEKLKKPFLKKKVKSEKETTENLTFKKSNKDSKEEKKENKNRQNLKHKTMAVFLEKFENLLPSETKENKVEKLEFKDLDVVTKTKTISQDIYSKNHSLDSGSGLSLFDQIYFQSANNEKLTKESVLWSMHYDEELKLAQEIPPINGFDEMIQLTNEGKLWKFPIDNEQDIDEVDAHTPFHEHVFLDHYLEEFPKIEPIQQFMTLALNGLSQNSYLSLNEKKEIIDWYKNYFTEKLDIINEALEAEKLEMSFRNSNQDSFEKEKSPIQI